MNLRKPAFRLFTIGAAIAAATALSAKAASADIGVSTTGALLTCNVYSDSKFNGHADCKLTDTKADSHSVYAVTQVVGFSSFTYKNVGGNGTVLNFTRPFTADGESPYIFRYKVCRDVQFGSDNCSPWFGVSL
jgi:hypothetical protein